MLRKPDRWDLVLLAACMLFYLLFPVMDGPVWCVDSAGYVSMHITREPLYPTFLALCRGIGRLVRMDALFVTVILQSLLAGAAAWYAGDTARKAGNGSRLLQAAAILCQFAVTLLCRFAANRGSAYTDSILTEGLGLSLFVFFSCDLFLYLWMRKSGYLCRTLLWSFLLVSLRKQMMVTLLIMGIVFAWYELIKNRRIRWFMSLCVMICGVFFAGKLFDRCYQYAVRGVWMEHSGNSMGILCTLLYSSDAVSDRELFEDETIRRLYEEIMEQADEQQILYPYAEPGWLPVAVHYADSYDAIGYGIINPVVEGYLSENFRYSDEEAAMKYDEICGVMSKTLFRQKLQPLLRVYLYNIWRGFVNSVAKANHLLSVYAGAVYLVTGIGAWYLIRQRRRLKLQIRQPSEGAEASVMKYRELMERIDRSLCFAFIVTAGIVINTLVVGMIIFTQPRYMIYDMGLFYTACCMLARDILACFQMRRAAG